MATGTIIVVIWALLAVIMGGIEGYRAWFMPQEYLDRYRRMYQQQPDGTPGKDFRLKQLDQEWYLTMNRAVLAGAFALGVILLIIFVPRLMAGPAG